MSVTIDGTNGINSSGSFYGQSTYTGSYTDGVVVDYTTGTGRVTVGSSDGFKIRNGGPSSPVDLISIDSNGIVTGNAGNLMLVSGTSVASTSGTSINFTGIPSWVKRITVMFAGVSTNGTSVIQIQAGTASGVVSSGYVAIGTGFGNSIATVSYTSGFGLSDLNSPAHVYSGNLTLTNETGNTWTFNGNLVRNITNAFGSMAAGHIALSATLDRVRITTVNGTDAFDAGSINILYE